MFQVTANREKNRLYVTLKGHLSPSERSEAGNAFLTAIRTLEHDFDIIHDLTGLHPTDAEGLKELARLQAAAKIRGVRRVVRIVSIPLSSNQLGRAAEDTGWSYETVHSMVEAEALLDGPEPY
jgi:hypothetical protein